MRDTIRNNAYFREYLTMNLKRIERFQNQLFSLEPENVMGRQNCAAFIANLYWSRICALYSSGADIDPIKELYPQYIRYLIAGINPQEGYFDVIDAISLGVLFDAKESLPDLKLVLQQTNMCNKLVDTLLCSLDNTWAVTDITLRCNWFLEFLNCAVAHRSDFLKNYLSKKWYREHKDAAWYNNHKSSANIYTGYWSFEVAAVAKIYDVPDSKEWSYYPYYLVHC